MIWYLCTESRPLLTSQWCCCCWRPLYRTCRRHLQPIAQHHTWTGNRWPTLQKKRTWAINAKVSRHIVYGNHSACIDPAVNGSKVRISWAGIGNLYLLVIFRLTDGLLPMRFRRACFSSQVLPPGTHCPTTSTLWLILSDFENCWTWNLTILALLLISVDYFSYFTMYLKIFVTHLSYLCSFVVISALLVMIWYAYEAHCPLGYVCRYDCVGFLATAVNELDDGVWHFTCTSEYLTCAGKNPADGAVCWCGVIRSCG